MISETTFKKVIIGALIIILLISAFIIVRPIIISIIWGLIMAYIFYPIYTFLFKRVKEENITALLIVFLVIFILFLPLWFFLPIISKQIFEVYSYFQTLNFGTLINNLIPGTTSPALQTEIVTLINGFISKVISALVSTFSGILINLPNIILQAVVALFTFFFALRDGVKLKEYIKDIAPFSKSLEKSISKEFKNMTKAVIFGFIVTGVVQGLFTGLGLFVFGVPQASLLTVVAIFTSIIPVLGAWIVWVPAAIYLLTTGHIVAGISLIIYGAVFISWLDNILRIWIVSRKTQLSSAIILIGMIGGLFVFGIIGLIIGPLVLSYLIILLDAYKEKKFSEIFG